MILFEEKFTFVNTKMKAHSYQNTVLVNLAISYEKEEGGRKVKREKKKEGGRERDHLSCSIEHRAREILEISKSSGDLWSVRSTSSEVHSNTVRGTSLTKELSLLWGRKRTRPVD